MEYKKILNKITLVWYVLFLGSAVFGALGYRIILPHMMPLLETGMKANEVVLSANTLMFAFILVKNTIVAVLCVTLGNITKGIFPTIVCTANGIVLGFIGGLLCNLGDVSWWKYIIALSPHGVLELTAIFITCTIGIMSIRVKEKMRITLVPLSMLVVAAIIETWVSPIVASSIL